MPDTSKTETPHSRPALRLVSGAKKEPLRCPAAGRDAENEKTLCFYFNRRVTDDEMRFLHTVIRQVALMREIDGH
ncbi:MULTISPECIES: hypothetical protein [unclassified Bradyrhizobium]|uniref:hypothetical protein n=1 Tax=unclassified Bradyrhizobium TaxID=2631580 RepID=UPI0023036475|nr:MULTISPECIES: hypothetical protein [unclassified Bradyrhizobium]MDA9398701.1 hypothetical protein [Bradyrhizobium sp. CCBAU 45389]MDA9528452.1 hypothetical protein [Bradyrhizobium sp. CCBAU 25338]